MNPIFLCVDAGLVIAMISPAEQALRARIAGLWLGWMQSNITLIAPPLFFAEVTSVLRSHVYFNRISEQDGEEAFSVFLNLGVSMDSLPDLQQRAWTLAKRYTLPRACDAQYLAVAASLGCDFWTTDHRLANAVREPWVRLMR